MASDGTALKKEGTEVPMLQKAALFGASGISGASCDAKGPILVPGQLNGPLHARCLFGQKTENAPKSPRHWHRSSDVWPAFCQS
jgi:hypothetical protein